MKNVKNFLSGWSGLLLVAVIIACQSATVKPLPHVLVFFKTTGFYHESIPAGIAAIQKLGKENGFTVDTTTDAGFFQDQVLKKYAAVIFLNTTGTLFDLEQRGAFQRYIRSGGGFAGIHSASDTEYEWDWYGRLVGGYFESHPEVQEASLHVKDHQHPSTLHLPQKWVRTDEWYNFKNLNPEVNVLLTIDEASYKGGKNGNLHPMAWWHSYDGGRVFYTALGHTKASYSEPLFLKHLSGGISYAMGEAAGIKK